MSGRPLDAVTFDYWNTLCYEPELFQSDRTRIDAVTRELDDAGFGDQRERVALGMKAVRERYLESWERNVQYTAVDAARDLAEAMRDLAPPASEVWGRVAEAFESVGADAEIHVVEGVGEALEELKRRDVKVGIVCDVGLLASPWLRRHLDRHGILDHFDHWSFSDEVGVYKPAPEIFHHALDGLGGVAAVRAAHIGDRRRTDVAGALGMGMRAVRLTTIYDDPDEGPSGDAVIASYADLLPALGF